MNRWSLNSKIYSVIAIFVLACLIICLEGLYKMSEINQALDKIVQSDSRRIQLAQSIKDYFSSQIIDEKNFILEHDKTGMEKLKMRAIERNDALLKTWADFNSIVATEAGRKNLAEFKSIYTEWWQHTKEVQMLSMTGDKEAAAKLSVNRGLGLRLKGEEVLRQLIERNQKFMQEAAVTAANNYAQAKIVMISISALALFLGLFIAWFVLKSVSRAIDEVITNLTDNSTQVTSAAHQIASSSEELSQASAEQASALEETSSAIEELNSMVHKNADNAKKTTQISDSSKLSASKGKAVVSEMILAIKDINSSNAAIMDSISDSNKKISEIVDVINEIGTKTKVINDIVFQTKLLSFNASVEAARAGDQGKGFAVVAEEVGNLAQMSGNAAKEITTMLDQSILKVQSIVGETKSKVESLVLSGREKVETGAKIAKDCGDVLDEIVSNISTVNTMSDEISVACSEQAQGVQEITRAMGQLDQVTQMNSTSSTQTAQAAVELSAQAESLRAVVAVLVKTIKGEDETLKASRSKDDFKAHHNEKHKPVKNVLEFKTKPAKNIAKNKYTKMVAGEEYVPLEDDPRFEQV